jgi:phosphoribosylformylglycinamidine synthase PurS subunit
MRVRVLVRLKSGILDPQGATVQRALRGLGFQDIIGLRVGKLIEVDVDAPTEEHARERVDEMCKKLLANPLLEDYTVEMARAPADADAAVVATRAAAAAVLPEGQAEGKMLTSPLSHRRRSIP